MDFSRGEEIIVKKKETLGGGNGRRPTRRTPKAQLPDVPPVFMMEQVNRAISKILEGHEFADVEEMNRFLQEEVNKHTIDELLAPIRQDPVEQAQELAYQAWGASSLQEARRMAQEALALDPACIDALSIIAIADAQSETDVIERLRGVITRAEEALGAEFMNEAAGDFWRITETRPYMRVRDQLMTRLRAEGRLDEAIAEAEAMLRLNPGDNQGERYQLLAMYLETGMIEDAKKLLAQFSDEAGGVLVWGRVLLHLLAGEKAEAEAAFHAAMQDNRYFFEYLTGRRELPDAAPTSYALGAPSEGAYILLQLGTAWMKYPVMVRWLESEYAKGKAKGGKGKK